MLPPRDDVLLVDGRLPSERHVIRGLGRLVERVGEQLGRLDVVLLVQLTRTETRCSVLAQKVADCVLRAAQFAYLAPALGSGPMISRIPPLVFMKLPKGAIRSV